MRNTCLIFSKFVEAMGYTLPVTREAVAFADANLIGEDYVDAVTAMQQAGIMMSRSDNKFRPRSNVTRAEVAAMLHRYIKLTIDPATAQGWAVNDDGQYIYYEDGKAVTGWFDIDGGDVMKPGRIDADGGDGMKRYYFTEDGIMVSGKWLELDGKWYYFNTDGTLAVSTKVDGYEVDEDGVRKTKSKG